MDLNALSALGIAVLAGLTTMIGAAVVLITEKKNDRGIGLVLGFAAGAMLCVSLTDLYPEALELFQERGVGKAATAVSVLCLLFGLLVGWGADQLLGHKHHGHEEHAHCHASGCEDGLLHIGKVSILAMAVHNFPEGIALFAACYGNPALGFSLAAATALHNIPGGVTMALPVYFATGSKKKAFGLTLLASMAEPLGAALACLILRPYLNGVWLAGIYGIVAGFLLYIAVSELAPASFRYGRKRETVLSLLAGACVMLLVHLA